MSEPILCENCGTQLQDDNIDDCYLLCPKCRQYNRRKETYKASIYHGEKTVEAIQSEITERFISIPPHALIEVAKVFGDGHRKYGSENMPLVTYDDNMNHAFRHIMLALTNDCVDEPSPEAHIAHAICRLLMALERRLV